MNKEKIYIWLKWAWVIIIGIFLVNALKTPMQVWEWGLYNNKLLAVFGLCVFTLIIDARIRIHKLEKKLRKKDD